MSLTLTAYAQPIKGAGSADEYLWVQIGPEVSAGVGSFLAQNGNTITGEHGSIGSLIESFKDRPLEIAKVGKLLEQVSSSYSQSRDKGDILSAQLNLLYLRLFSDVLRYLIQTKPDGSFLNHVVVRWA